MLKIKGVCEKSISHTLYAILNTRSLNAVPNKCGFPLVNRAGCMALLVHAPRHHINPNILPPHPPPNCPLTHPSGHCSPLAQHPSVLLAWASRPY